MGPALERVGAVHSARHDLDQHLAVARHWVGNTFDPQCFRAAGRGNRDSSHRSPPNGEPCYGGTRLMPRWTDSSRWPPLAAASPAWLISALATRLGPGRCRLRPRPNYIPRL